MSVLDILVIIAVFGLTAYVGYRSSKQVKDIDDFTLAGSKLGKLQAGFSMAATEFGGSSLVGTMAFCYAVGISGAWWSWSAGSCAYSAWNIFCRENKTSGDGYHNRIF